MIYSIQQMIGLEEVGEVGLYVGVLEAKTEICNNEV